MNNVLHDRHSQSSEAQAGSDVCRAAYGAPPGREEGHHLQTRPPSQLASQSQVGLTWQSTVGLLDLQREG